MFIALSYNVCLNRNGYVNTRGKRQHKTGRVADAGLRVSR